LRARDTRTRPLESILYHRQIEATDRGIDALVYELYGLTEEEVAIVERAGQWTDLTKPK
jgi:hypothetical protein